MSGRKPLYRKYVFFRTFFSPQFHLHFYLLVFKPVIFCFCRAFVFFSSPIAKELVLEIKKDTLVLPRIGALREVKFCFCFLNIYELYFKLNIRRKQFHMLLIVIFSFHCAWQMNLEYFAIDSQVCGMWLYFIYLAFHS